MLNRNRRKINALDTSRVNRSNGVTFWIDAFAVRMHTANWAKAMFDHVLVERVRARCIFRRKKMQRGANQSSDPLRSQIEQLQANASLKSPSTSKATLPQ
jgi:hypothetical protein